MTKRAMIIISALIILPLIITAVAWSSARKQNRVVAQWDEDRVSVIYNGERYSPVGKVGERKFSTGEYLGKIGDSLFGAPLYRVKDDSAGYLCCAKDGKTLILFSKTGLPLDGIPDGGVPGELIFNGERISDAESIALLRSLEALTDPAKVTDRDDMPTDFSTKKYKGKYTMYKIWEVWGGSAVALDSGVRLFHMNETGNWYFVTIADAAKAEAKEAEYFTYTARPLKDKTALAFIEGLTHDPNDTGTGVSDSDGSADAPVTADPSLTSAPVTNNADIPVNG